MKSTVCLVFEVNCYEPSPQDHCAASIWLVPYSLVGDAHDFDHHKPRATRIVGPVTSRVAEQVGNALAAALSGLEFAVEQETIADD